MEQRGDAVAVQHGADANEAHDVKRTANTFGQGAQEDDSNERNGEN